MTYDHIKPRSKGHALAGNLALVCCRCNHDKGSLSLGQWLTRLVRAGDARADRIEAFMRDLGVPLDFPRSAAGVILGACLGRPEGLSRGSTVGEVPMTGANLTRHSNEQVLSLADAAKRLGWSRRTLIRALVRHGIPTMGRGERARLDAADLETLKAKEWAIRATSTAPQEPARGSEFVSSGETSTESSLRRHWRRRLDQLNRENRGG